jgi:glutamyl/glutaminyl-tRNA synthetase
MYRLAPTPSGFLHIGNAVNFLLNFQASRREHEGKLLLRIDDLDAARKKPEYIEDIFESLEWLGIEWDLGPKNAKDFEENWSQYRRMDLYEEILKNLRANGLLYACQKSRREIEDLGMDYLPKLRNQGLSLDAKGVAWRIKTADDFPLLDFVVRRKDGIPAYQVASVADDVHFGITHIIRGQDLEASTKAQLCLAEMLGLKSFLSIKFEHHRLILDENGLKLSKSKGSTSLKSMRESGKSAEEIINFQLSTIN